MWRSRRGLPKVQGRAGRQLCWRLCPGQGARMTGPGGRYADGVPRCSAACSPSERCWFKVHRGLHGESAACTAEHGDLPEPGPRCRRRPPRSHGDRLDRGRVQPAPDVRPVPGQRRDQRLVLPSCSGRSRPSTRPPALGDGSDAADPAGRRATTRSPSPTRSGLRRRGTDNAPIAADDSGTCGGRWSASLGGDPAITTRSPASSRSTAARPRSSRSPSPGPAWRELFNDLLPAHIVKDVPGGFPAYLVRRCW